MCQLPGRQLGEGMGAQNPRLSLTCITGTEQIVCDGIASAWMAIVLINRPRVRMLRK